ncbi:MULTISPECIES: hypothetical protein [unclassified Shewanella]|uniref:hypothetical protein n=1 Tax=unclassified Shewanella TaxID=196818 RepID=UPI001BC59E47|nr:MULTISPECIES: hypothetical protein [unclassified Shewanella]GIU13872.1 MSHA biogenesis protein MshF [Shewanella sp. MBTL60-112-B1]GIU28397.1 MSHA biogenesis protein MshF [Shewanella sp. MBTL60-112-B2]
MLSQHKADAKLLDVYGKLIALIILLIVLFYLSFNYFGSIKQLAQPSMQVEHTRLLNVLGVARSQWLMRSKPEILQLDWYSDSQEHASSTGQVRMAASGWPIPSETSVAGCRQLLVELLGPGYTKQIDTRFNPDTGVCRYLGESGESISYQTTSGRVIFLTQTD